MIVEVQYIAGCSNARRLLRRLKELAVTRSDLTLTMTEVVRGQPVPTGFVGSPTVRIDGRNPFGGTPVDTASSVLKPPTMAQVEAALSPGHPAP